MWTDDTPVTVLTGGEEGSRQGRFWTYIGDSNHPSSVYDFTLSRGRDGPQGFMQTFQGYLHADAYAGYDAIFLGSGSRVLEVACWARAPTRSVGLRRKFFDARKNYPREAHQVLEWIGQLYDIEDRARELPADSRCELRCAEANPALDRLEAYLSQLAARLLPKSALAKAVTYAQPMESATALHNGRSVDNRQQRERKDAASPGDRA